jgi:hypothetical protein
MAKKRSRSHPQVPPAPGPLDAALLVTFGGEAMFRVVEYSHAPATQTIQEFAVHVQEVSARPSDPGANDDRDLLRLAQRIFQAYDKREQPYLRTIGRVLDELLNHRRYRTCSGGDVYYVLLDELPDELPAAHQQVLEVGQRDFNRTLNPGRRSVDNRLRELKGESREDGRGSGPAYVATTSTTRGGAEQGYMLTEDGQWLFDGWPELPELVLGRATGMERPPL